MNLMNGGTLMMLFHYFLLLRVEVPKDLVSVDSIFDINNKERVEEKAVVNFTSQCGKKL